MEEDFINNRIAVNINNSILSKLINNRPHIFPVNQGIIELILKMYLPLKVVEMGRIRIRIALFSECETATFFMLLDVGHSVLVWLSTIREGAHLFISGV